MILALFWMTAALILGIHIESALLCAIGGIFYIVALALHSGLEDRIEELERQVNMLKKEKDYDPCD